MGFCLVLIFSNKYAPNSSNGWKTKELSFSVSGKKAKKIFICPKIQTKTPQIINHLQAPKTAPSNRFKKPSSTTFANFLSSFPTHATPIMMPTNVSAKANSGR